VAELDAGPEIESPLPETGGRGVDELFRARYLEMVRLAGLLGADDPEDIAQEAFARLIRKRPPLSDMDAALPYLRAIVCNLTRNRHRHLRVVRLRTPAAVDEDSCEQAAILREDHREVIAALAELPPRRREASRARNASRSARLSRRKVVRAMSLAEGGGRAASGRGSASRRERRTSTCVAPWSRAVRCGIDSDSPAS
jgi:hypothetical protein